MIAQRRYGERSNQVIVVQCDNGISGTLTVADGVRTIEIYPVNQTTRLRSAVRAAHTS